jgi:hypothetical protein
MAGARRRSTPVNQPELPGIGVDAFGGPVIDPTTNVLNLVDAAIRRQDDLREADNRRLTEIAELRAEYDEKLRRAETARIDAIRAVDVGAVNRAAEVSAQQAMTLAAQVATSAETLRAQVAAAATAAVTGLAAALEPIQKDIADLRKTQYEQAGQKAQVGETRQRGAGVGLWIGLAVAGAGFVLTGFGFLISTGVAIYALTQ